VDCFRKEVGILGGSFPSRTLFFSVGRNMENQIADPKLEAATATEPKRPLAVWTVSLFLLWMTASSASGLYFAQTGQAKDIPAPFQLETARGIFELLLASANLLAAAATSLLLFAGRASVLRALSVWFWINLLTVGWFLGFKNTQGGSLLQLGAPALVTLALLFYARSLERNGWLRRS
jgi:hypothetical protein